MLPHHIAVIGSPGSGKTRLASNLAESLGLAHVELDALFWGPKWTPPEPKAFLSRTRVAMEADGWVMDGNYSAVRDMVWREADTVVWLSYPLRVVLRQLFLRTVRRIVSGEVLWNDNTETFREQFLSRESLFLYAVRHVIRSRRRFRLLLMDPRYGHLRKVQLHSPAQEREWMAGIRDQVKR